MRDVWKGETDGVLWGESEEKGSEGKGKERERSWGKVEEDKASGLGRKQEAPQRFRRGRGVGER